MVGDLCFHMGYDALIVFQDLAWHQADVLADAVELAEGIDGSVTLAGDGLERLPFLDLVQVNLRCEGC